MNKRQKGAVLSYINTFVQIFANLIYVPILLNSIGDREYGLYQLLASIIAYLSVMETSLSASVMRFYCKYKSLGQKEEMENTLGTSRLIFRRNPVSVLPGPISTKVSTPSAIIRSTLCCHFTEEYT